MLTLMYLATIAEVSIIHRIDEHKFYFIFRPRLATFGLYAALKQKLRNVFKTAFAFGVNLKYFLCDRRGGLVYRQSFIPAHSEMTWLLDCFTYMGEMQRMNEFKDKSAKEASVSMGLMNYPVLMAADILLYGAKTKTIGVLLYEMQTYADPQDASVLAILILLIVLTGNLLLRKLSRGSVGI